MTATLTLAPLADTVGAEAKGVDAERLVADGLGGAVLGALETYGVLVFRGLDLEPEAQVAFCEQLGQVDDSQGHHPVRGIFRVTLDTSKNANADYLRGTFEWHIDGCTPLHGEFPQMATMLSAKAIADSGGETEFASTYAAYEDLNDVEKELVGTLQVVHTLEASQRRQNPDPTPGQLAGWRARPTAEHPLVWTHRNGRKSLVIGASADHVVGMGLDEGRALLEELLARSTRPERVYHHSWAVGDTVIWDNRGVLHRALPYPSDSPREMLRTTVLGDEPIE
ncbi:MAG TPA: TauD/TfdA family dioxygenase [Acidimicrobiales bacterium]|nr:TauD/TfdA family dioxygenase [Acidimicrobiales bacterium]